MPPEGFKVYQTRPGPTEDITGLILNGQSWMHPSKTALLKRRGNRLIVAMLETGIVVQGDISFRRINEYYMNVRLKVPSTYGSRPRGFFGSPDGNRNNDLYERDAVTPISPPYSDRLLYRPLLTCKHCSYFQ